MSLQVILTDINNYKQFIVSSDHSIINKVFEIMGDIPIPFKTYDEPFVVVQKMIENKTDEQLILTDRYDHYYYYIDEDNTHYKFKRYENLKYKHKEHEENKYLNLMEELIYKGDYRKTRNGFTYSLFGKSLEFDISQSFPLLTTKKVFFRGIIEELLFFLNGKTDSKVLESIGVNIWKGNTTKEFIESRKLNYREGDMGPMYGFNWLHFGAKYEGCDADYSNKGFNQLDQVLKLLKEDPTSRRIIMTTYNPAVAEEGVLYPCHGIVVQFYVNVKNGINYVSCSMTQRSADIACGVPYNIASYAALVYMICKYLGDNYKPDKLIMNLGDVHLYEEHIKEALIQIKRKPYDFPKLEINEYTKIEELKYEDFKLIEYKSHEALKYIMKP